MEIETLKHLRVVQIKNIIVKLVKKQRISSATSINIFFEFFHMELGWIQKWFDSSQEKHFFLPKLILTAAESSPRVTFARLTVIHPESSVSTMY